jgi:hypothetical protein
VRPNGSFSHARAILRESTCPVFGLQREEVCHVVATALFTSRSRRPIVRLPAQWVPRTRRLPQSCRNYIRGILDERRTLSPTCASLSESRATRRRCIPALASSVAIAAPIRRSAWLPAQRLHLIPVPSSIPPCYSDHDVDKSGGSQIRRPIEQARLKKIAKVL